MQKEDQEAYSVLWGCAVLCLGPLPSLSQPLAVPDSPRTELPLIALPQTPRLTLKLSWLRPRRGSIPGLGSPAALCRWSGTSLRWPSVYAARSPKTEPQPHPHPTARPRLSPGLSAPASPPQKGASSLHFPPARCPSPCPRWSRPKCACGEEGGGRIRLNCCKQFRGVGCVEAPPFVFHVAWRVMLALSVQFMCPCGRLAGTWGHLPVCVLFVCLCLGRS